MNCIEVFIKAPTSIQAKTEHHKGLYRNNKNIDTYKHMIVWILLVMKNFSLPV